jgi:type I restriction enzyme S subunit
VSDLPRGWAIAPLGDIAETRLGKMLSAKARTGNGARPYLRNKNVQWARIDVDDLLTMDFTDDEFAKFRLCEGDLLVCEGGEVGRAAIWKAPLVECAYQKALHRVRPREGVVPEYVLYLLMHYASARAFDQHITGSTIAHLPQEDLRRLPVPLPPLAEQRRIVAAIEEHFSRLNAGLATVGLLQVRAEALERQSFGGAFAAGGEVELGEVASFIRGVTYKKQDARSAPTAGYIPLLRATNISGDLLLDGKLVYVPRARVSADQILKRGDLVMATSSGSAAVVGKSAMLSDEWEGTFGAFCGVLRPTALLDPGYLAAFCNAPTVRRRWSELARGTNINNLRAGHILSTSIRIPELAIQRKIVTELSQQLVVASVVHTTVAATRRRAESLRRAILGRAFRGALLPQDPGDEPASVLLLRIAAQRAAALKATQKKRKPPA